MRCLPAIFFLVLAAAPAGTQEVAAPKMAPTYMADGFDFPCGKPEGEGYYKARGYRANGHLGEDWNGKRGGDTDLGDPVCSCANGAVVFAADFGHGWGNVVIIRHVYQEGGENKYVDSLYGHLDQIQTRYGLHIRRGQQIGTIGTGGGLYPAHLHFEMRKDLRVGMARHRFPHDDRIYYSPTDFILAHRKLVAPTPTANIPINTFVEYKVTAEVDDSDTPAPAGGFVVPGGAKPAPAANKDWKPDRYDDLKKKGAK
jgi:murein DD-endopeptidase MepM/ murein hydrolase activator NlpD